MSGHSSRRTLDAPGEGDDLTEQVRHLLVRVSGEWLGLALTDLEGVEPAASLLRLPGTPAWCLGVWVRRGSFVPVCDPLALLRVAVPGAPLGDAYPHPHLGPEPPGSTSLFVLARTDSGSAALIVDQAGAIVHLPAAAPEPGGEEIVEPSPLRTILSGDLPVHLLRLPEIFRRAVIAQQSSIAERGFFS